VNEEVINRIAEILGQSGGAIVNEYIVWFVVKAIIWTVIPALCAVLVLRWKPANAWDLSGPAVLAIKASIVGTMILIGGCHVPDLIAPRAIAINQLLNDVTP
jgi:hypothetical protein